MRGSNGAGGQTGGGGSSSSHAQIFPSIFSACPTHWLSLDFLQLCSWCRTKKTQPTGEKLKSICFLDNIVPHKIDMNKSSVGCPIVPPPKHIACNSASVSVAKCYHMVGDKTGCLNIFGNLISFLGMFVTKFPLGFFSSYSSYYLFIYLFQIR